jgi:hypothetical protein
VCGGCGEFIIPDETGRAAYTQAGDKTFHKHCFKCEECGVLFGGSVEGPYNVGGKLLCKPHAIEFTKKNGSGRKSGGLGGSAASAQDRSIAK